MGDIIRIQAYMMLKSNIITEDQFNRILGCLKGEIDGSFEKVKKILDETN